MQEKEQCDAMMWGNWCDVFIMSQAIYSQKLRSSTVLNSNHEGVCWNSKVVLAVYLPNFKNVCQIIFSSFRLLNENPFFTTNWVGLSKKSLRVAKNGIFCQLLRYFA